MYVLKKDSLPYKCYKKRIYNIFKVLIYSFSATNELILTFCFYQDKFDIKNTL